MRWSSGTSCGCSPWTRRLCGRYPPWRPRRKEGAPQEAERRYLGHRFGDDRNPMKLGLLADIHEHTEHLRKAIAVLQRHGADRFVVLGDVCETGQRIAETIDLL